MARLATAPFVLAALFALAGCGAEEISPVVPSSTPAAPVGAPAWGPDTAMSSAGTRQPRLTICHRIPGRGFTALMVAEESVPAHLAHGDGRPGDSVPGVTGMVFAPACVPVSAQVVVLDQSYDPPSFLSFGFGGDSHLAQTFTVGVAGVLDRVDVKIRRDAGIPDVVFDLRPTAGGVPLESEASALVSIVIPSASIPADFGFVSLDVRAAGIPVSPGDVLAIVLRAPGPGDSLNYSWQGTAGNAYASGADFYRSASSTTWSELHGDLGFRTFVAQGAVTP